MALSVTLHVSHGAPPSGSLRSALSREGIDVDDAPTLAEPPATALALAWLPAAEVALQVAGMRDGRPHTGGVLNPVGQEVTA